MNNDDLLQSVLEIAYDAGTAIMEIYIREFDVTHKIDDKTSLTSPLTEADMAANQIIEKQLKIISQYPIVSEENLVRQGSELFWLVDPLDGTKEFIKKNGEFTVNIALIKGGSPLLGVVYAPAKEVAYIGDVEKAQAYKISHKQDRQLITSTALSVPPRVVVSKSHKDQKTEEFLAGLKTEYIEQSIGSSLKLCLVAEGQAMLYPRLGPTSFWDTAAADAVVRAAGGKVVDLSGRPLTYQLDSGEILNPSFVVEASNNTLQWP